MSWFFIALIPPFLYALTNHTDKYLISKYIHEGKVGALIIFSALFSIFATPVILIIHPAVLQISAQQAFSLSIIGSLAVLSILCYLYALKDEEASLVIPFYQTIPIFGFILAYFILGETLSARQLLASALIVLGALVISFDLSGEKIRFKKKVVLLMTLASVMYAASDVMFKFIAVEKGFWISAFWTMIGKVFIGILFLLFISSYRLEFLNMLKKTKSKVLMLSSLNESVTIVADVVVQYAFLLTSVALVLMVNGFQPLFVFLIGVILTQLFPQISKENLNKTIVTQKIIGIVVILIGTTIL